MKRRTRSWAYALAFSLAAHAGAAAVLMRGEDGEVRISGGQQIEIALLGNAFEDAVSAGDEFAAVEPLSAEQQPAETVQPEPAIVAPRVVPDTQPVEPVTAMQQPLAPDQSAPASPSRAAPIPSERAAETPQAEPLDPQAAAELEVEETVAALVHVPVPAVRPIEPAKAAEPAARAQAPVQPVEEREAKRKPERAPRSQQQAPERAGNRGTAQADARKGQADGAERGRQAASGRSGNSREAGNAAVSNYPGTVVSKLRRSLRYPPAARRDRLRGEVQVSFTVGGGGSVSEVRVVRSSGSQVLDQAALETVRRAAPFPPIPDGRPIWSFTVPLAFAR